MLNAFHELDVISAKLVSKTKTRKGFITLLRENIHIFMFLNPYQIHSHFSQSTRYSWFLVNYFNPYDPSSKNSNVYCISLSLPFLHRNGWMVNTFCTYLLITNITHQVFLGFWMGIESIGFNFILFYTLTITNIC